MIISLRAAGKSKFITPEIKKAMWKRNAPKSKFNKKRSADDWEVYRSQRNRVVALRRESIIRILLIYSP